MKSTTNNLSLQRLNRLSDFVYASAMTILVLMLKFPTAEEIENNEMFEGYLLDALPRLYLFVITFITVAIYWMKDLDQYKHIVDTDTGHMWYQILSLAFVVLLPWSNALMEIKPELFAVRLFYGLDILLIGVFSYLGWRTATDERKFVTDEVSNETISKIRRDALSEPIIAVIAIIAALIRPEFFDYVFILIPLTFILQKQIKSKVGNWRKRIHSSK